MLPGAPLVASLLLTGHLGIPDFGHLVLTEGHGERVPAPVTSSVALVTRSDALVPSSVLVTTSKAPVTSSVGKASMRLGAFLVQRSRGSGLFESPELAQRRYFSILTKF